MGFDWLVALHLTVLALGTGMSFANWLNWRLARNMADDEAGSSALARLRLLTGRVGDVVIALIWISGIALVMRFTGAEAANAGALPPAFHAKMLLVVLLTLFHGISRWAGLRVSRQGRTSLVPVASSAALGAALSAIGSIVLAVASFR